MLLTLAPIALLVAPLVSALAVVTPNAQTVWDQNGGRNVIQWALYPLTNPAPASQFFDIYIRNGLASVYPNYLNASIGQNLDASSNTFAVAFPLSPGQLLAGSGYQIFFTDPNNANTYYAQSEVFSLAPAQGASPGAASSSLAITSVASSAVSALISSTTTSGRFPTAAIPTTVTTSTSTMTPSSSSASRTGDAPIHAATNPGGSAEQGFGLGFSAAEGLGTGAWRVSLAALGVGAGALFWL